jgi:hypothetical protein
MIVEGTVTVDELVLVALAALPIAIWGFRHGLDAVMIAVIGVLGGMLLSDTIAGGTVQLVNTTWRSLRAFIDPGLDSPDFFTAFREGPGLIETPEHITLSGTIVFLLITYVAFKLAFKRAGGRGGILEGVFGAIGGAVTGYIIVTFIIPRHFRLPVLVQVTPATQMPEITLDANVLVLVALVIIVFGVQNSRAKKK